MLIAITGNRRLAAGGSSGGEGALIRMKGCKFQGRIEFGEHDAKM